MLAMLFKGGVWVGVGVGVGWGWVGGGGGGAGRVHQTFFVEVAL